MEKGYPKVVGLFVFVCVQKGGLAAPSRQAPPLPAGRPDWPNRPLRPRAHAARPQLRPPAGAGLGGCWGPPDPRPRRAARQPPCAPRAPALRSQPFPIFLLLLLLFSR